MREGLFGGLAIGALLAANMVAAGSALERIADPPIGRHDGNPIAGAVLAANFNGNGNSGNFNGNGNSGSFNGNGNSGSFNGNGNAGNFNGNANCGNGFGNGYSSDGNGNGKGQTDVPAWCRYLKDLNSRLGLPPGTIPDFD
ncbi:hypothetical protein FJ987_02945 [Mesorhizobium sp. CU2]|uniref:hypothetical protein n=1 Tax=unclassified Mesorhizobium TaxID=325217 RepID=UPI001127262A|nr:MULTISPECIES: hypothetical protein [unclassified Mesorhizobium]TPN84143.1 hypothetical protein FJ988_10960 [Mesorhizobium sp. CU3]TPO21151.1 hypothetical protein FJ987_02945 [Mesorhizobium sp. CU2]